MRQADYRNLLYVYFSNILCVRARMYSINKGQFSQRQEEALFTVTPFSKISITMGSFMSQKTVSMILFIDCCTRNFFSTRESMCFHYMDCLFDTDLKWKIHV